MLQAGAGGAAGVIEKAGVGVLSIDAVKDLAQVVGNLLGGIKTGEKEDADGHRKKKDVFAKNDEDDDDDEEETVEPSPQAVRFALEDVMTALLKANTADFAGSVMPT